MIIAGVVHVYRRILAFRRKRETYRALCALPENILQDIGWPALDQRADENKRRKDI
ncbi:hypothetical protein GCM10011491_31500 [Brucella endophytica]|uniref:DUF1127 domain-containing protein n=1 Tax=Brucella endophytica TaxID=1963359 RepID=A0A916SIM9_9HYPH|nr:hypothetical protein [Brucella endophytica]GGB01056.1 hypothetical protein GCM10011491_31500 [Brucella endophytica]